MKRPVKADSVRLEGLSERKGAWRKGERKYILNKLTRKYGLRCWYCGLRDENLNEYSDQGWHVDHIIPLARGGKSELDNYAIACPMCNRAKFDLDKDRFLKWLELVRVLCPPIEAD